MSYSEQISSKSFKMKATYFYIPNVHKTFLKNFQKQRLTIASKQFSNFVISYLSVHCGQCFSTRLRCTLIHTSSTLSINFEEFLQLLFRYLPKSWTLVQVINGWNLYKNTLCVFDAMRQTESLSYSTSQVWKFDNFLTSFTFIVKIDCSVKFTYFQVNDQQPIFWNQSKH